MPGTESGSSASLKRIRTVSSPTTDASLTVGAVVSLAALVTLRPSNPATSLPPTLRSGLESGLVYVAVTVWPAVAAVPRVSVTVLPLTATAVGVWAVPPTETEKLPAAGTEAPSRAMLKMNFSVVPSTDASVTTGGEASGWSVAPAG